MITSHCPACVLKMMKTNGKSNPFILWCVCVCIFVVCCVVWNVNENTKYMVVDQKNRSGFGIDRRCEGGGEAEAWTHFLFACSSVLYVRHTPRDHTSRELVSTHMLRICLAFWTHESLKQQQQLPDVSSCSRLCLYTTMIIIVVVVVVGNAITC